MDPKKDELEEIEEASEHERLNEVSREIFDLENDDLL